jgi:hypothetical protein
VLRDEVLREAGFEADPLAALREAELREEREAAGFDVVLREEVLREAAGFDAVLREEREAGLDAVLREEREAAGFDAVLRVLREEVLRDAPLRDAELRDALAAGFDALAAGFDAPPVPGSRRSISSASDRSSDAVVFAAFCSFLPASAPVSLSVFATCLRSPAACRRLKRSASPFLAMVLPWVRCAAGRRGAERTELGPRRCNRRV